MRDGRVQLTTDTHKAYLEAVEDAVGADIDYAQLQKVYGASNEPGTRYSPAKCIGRDMKTVSGDPDPAHVSTGYVERQNLAMSNVDAAVHEADGCLFNKIENHVAAVALQFIHYNFARIHKTLRITPAMAACLCDHVWSYEEIAALT